MTAIGTKLAHMLEMAVYTEFVEGGWLQPRLRRSGEDVLYVEMDIVNLYISAPQLNNGDEPARHLRADCRARPGLIVQP